MSADLVLRCLNALRRQHVPTYVAMRYLAESSVSSDESNFARNSILRRYLSQPAVDFHEAPRFKGLDIRGEPEYRQMHIPSPIGCLAEAVILEEVSKQSAFKKHERTYSYLWPNPKAKGFNFQHYFDGYTARNEEIAVMLEKDRSKVAVIVDIRQFYPSVDKLKAKDRFFQALDVCNMNADVLEASRICCEVSLSITDGLPIGPEISHVLGDLILQDVDDALFSRFGICYFRYVDDIVIISDASDAVATMSYVTSTLDSYGLSAHEGKCEIVNAEDWLELGPKGSDNIQPLSFGALVFRLKTFIASKPDLISELNSRLIEKSIFMPLDVLRPKAEIARFHLFLRRMWEPDWSVVKSIIADNPESVANFASQVKVNAQKRFKSFVESGCPSEGFRRKWYLQRLRQLVNELLYLGSNDDLDEAWYSVHAFPELAEVSEVIRVLRSGYIESLLNFPGPATMTVGSLAAIRERKKYSLAGTRMLNKVHLESFGCLQLFGLVDSARNIEAKSEKEDLFLRFCSGSVARKRELLDFSYIDEIRCLQIGSEESNPHNILKTRFSDGEIPVFDALQLGGKGSGE